MKRYYVSWKISVLVKHASVEKQAKKLVLFKHVKIELIG